MLSAFIKGDNMSDYYDGTKLLSLSDRNGEKPEIYICVGNRTAGKSVFFKRLCLNGFVRNKKKFVLLYRFNYELPGCSQMFFNDIEPLFFQGSEMREESVAKGMFYKLFYNEEECGFAVSLSNSDALKKYSSFFVDVENVFMDEFQSETNHYAPDELTKFQSVHVTMARGQGKQYRYIRTMLASNSVSIINPYFVAFGIHKLLRDNTNYLRGNGWVLEQTFNESASKAIEQSAFNKAFQSQYMSYASQNVYLNDNKAFIEHISGYAVYRCTIKFGNKYFAVREFTQDGIVYINDKPDMNNPLKLVFKAGDHDQNLLMADRSSMVLNYLKKAFNTGVMRFNSLEAKNMIFDILSIK